jgi:hypothetical protein
MQRWFSCKNCNNHISTYGELTPGTICKCGKPIGYERTGMLKVREMEERERDKDRDRKK